MRQQFLSKKNKTFIQKENVHIHRSLIHCGQKLETICISFLGQT